MTIDSGTVALIDNSAFAGVMRLYCPDVSMHKIFLCNYPEHRSIDEQSLADFLTALVIYDRILLDSSSAWNERELKIEGYHPGPFQSLDGSSASWAEQLLRFLPTKIALLVKTGYFNGITEDESTQKAFDVMCSPLKGKIALSHGEKIPNVYFADDYLYRPRFEALNESNGYVLNESELAQAMFLHRGIFLQSIAHEKGCVYLPYQYRGKMLAELPPMIWARAPDDGLARARLPLENGARPNETEYLRSLNAFYYSFLESVSWTTYSADVPFIGAAILAKTKGNPHEAIRIAMEMRDQGVLKAQFAGFHRAIRSHDRPAFESLLKGYRSDLQAAARQLGVEIENPAMERFYKLATCWLPAGLKEAFEAAVELLPQSVRDWGREDGSLLIMKKPLQMLFLDHVHAIRSI